VSNGGEPSGAWSIDWSQVSTAIAIFAFTSILAGAGYTLFAVWGSGGKVDQITSRK